MSNKEILQGIEQYDQEFMDNFYPWPDDSEEEW